MKNRGQLQSITMAVLAQAVLSQSVAFASDLSKIGKAITYPVRKTASNASVDTHRAIGHNSVVRRHSPRHRHHHNMVVTPGGHIKPVTHH